MGETLTTYPTNAEVWRAELSIGHFVAVGRKHFAKMGISLDDSANFLQRAVNESLKVEDLRAILPSTGGKEEWIKSVNLMVKRVEKNIIYAPTLGVSDLSYKLARKASEIYVRLMKKVIEQEMSK